MLSPAGTFQPLGFYLAHLNPSQKKYIVFKKELLGAFKSLRHFLPEIYGKHCTIYTDHLPLKMAFESNTIPLNEPQVYRQITEIGRFTRDVRHVSGVENTFADFLSRITPQQTGSAFGFVIPVLKVAVTNPPDFFDLSNFYLVKLISNRLSLRPLCSSMFRSNKKCLVYQLLLGQNLLKNVFKGAP